MLGETNEINELRSGLKSASTFILANVTNSRIGKTEPFGPFVVELRMVQHFFNKKVDPIIATERKSSAGRFSREQSALIK